MTKILDLSDIQGNITRAYGRYSFPQARYIFYRVDNAERGRQFVTAVIDHVTTAVTWGDVVPKPEATTNIAFTYKGLAVRGKSLSY